MKLKTLMLRIFCLLFLIPSSILAQLPQINVSENHRFLQTKDGKPFFWTGDTAWELIHRLDNEEVDYYFEKRASQGFNIVQTVVLAEIDGLQTPNAYGEKPFISIKPFKFNPEYIKHVRKVIEIAEKYKMYVAVLPTWGDKLFKDNWGEGPEILDEAFAFEYGKYLGLHLRDKTNIVWVLGGDRNPREGTNDIKVWQSMARGIQEGLGVFVTGTFTFHPQPASPGGSSNWFHNDEWLGFNMHQTGHCPNQPTYKKISYDYNLTPIKPTLDGEPLYEDHPNCFNAKEKGYSVSDDIRRIMYWNVFAGALGQTYGCHDVWQMFDVDQKPINGPLRPWKVALDMPMANQMKHLKNLMLSRPFFDRIPDQSLIEGEQEDDNNYVIGTRDDSGTYAMLYFPTGKTVNINTKELRGQNLRIWWYDTRTGATFVLGNTINYGSFSAVPPSSASDWVLVIDDASKGYDKPGTVAY